MILEPFTIALINVYVCTHSDVQRSWFLTEKKDV